MSEETRTAKYLFICVLLLALIGCSGPGFQKSQNAPVTPTMSTPETTAPASTIGIGILGDSNSDEYQADDERGGKYHAVTFNWVELLAMDRGLNFGRWGTWEEPRRTGYEYNWAWSGATASSMISSGQHTGVAQQVAAGKVALVFIWIGANDFHLKNGTYEEIYNGSVSDAELEAKTHQVVADITTAVDTILEAGIAKIVIVTLSDKGLVPQAEKLFPDATKRQRVADAIQTVNASIQELGKTRGVYVVDINEFGRNLLSRVDQSGFLQVGDQKIDILNPGDEPHHAQLGDFAGHPGTVASGLIANALFMESFNKTYGTGIMPLTDEEILSNAGLK